MRPNPPGSNVMHKCKKTGNAEMERKYSESELWLLLDDLLDIWKNHKDKTGVDKLNRLLRKGFDEIKSSSINLNPASSRIHLREGVKLEHFPNIQLAHKYIGNGDSDKPLVFLNWNGYFYVADGTHRINSWKISNTERVFSVVEVSLKQQIYREAKNA